LSTVHDLIERHVRYTGSTVGKNILDRWNEMLPFFVKVMPRDYRRALDDMKKGQAMLTIQHTSA
jgi:glutamate synthase (NADPH/NADH) large chain